MVQQSMVLHLESGEKPPAIGERRKQIKTGPFKLVDLHLIF